MTEHDYDYVIIGSGFGGSVSGLRLVEKGYRVLLLEKGREITPDDLPKSTWDLRRWMWMPQLGWRGFFRMTFLPHLTALTGVGVGGGSTTYAASHPRPKRKFFVDGSWAGLHDNWQAELEPHYQTAERMLGVVRNRILGPADKALRALAAENDQQDACEPTDVAIHFGTPGKVDPDPFFDGEGPERTGCIGCGGCMLGCPYGSKNSLDRNYLWLARKRGLELRSSCEVEAVRPCSEGGYQVEVKVGEGWSRTSQTWTAANVIVAGGVLGTVDLLLRMKADPNGLPKLSDKVGAGVRTNAEAFIAVVAPDEKVDRSKGVAIGSIWHVAEDASIEPVRYAAGQPGFFRALVAPHAPGNSALHRFARLIAIAVRNPLVVAKAALVGDWGKRTTILLYMQTGQGTLSLRRAWHGGLTTAREQGPAPRAAIPEATALAHRYGDKFGGMPFSLVSETALDIPTTGHILGGACMGASANDGVIDRDHRVFNYDGLYVIDGSTVSANPGVNPSLTITALAERAMANIPPKSDAQGLHPG